MSENTKKAEWSTPKLEEVAIADTAAGKVFGNQEAGNNHKKTRAS
ncbi:hypothetical protein [Lysobacter tyrosinilyticus]